MVSNEDQSVVRESAAGAGVHIVQAGWWVNDRDGERIGQVVERDADSMTVELEGGGGEQVAIPTSLIGEEDEGARLATLIVGSSELHDVTPMGERSDEPEPLPPPLA